jgi:hypothetical protein
LAEIKRLKELCKEGKKKDSDGLSIVFQMLELRIELNLLKEIFNHATDVNQKEGEICKKDSKA